MTLIYLQIMLRSDIIAKANEVFPLFCIFSIQVKGDSQMKQLVSRPMQIIAIVMVAIVSIYAFVGNRLVFTEIDKEIYSTFETEEEKNQRLKEYYMKMAEQGNKKRKKTENLKQLKK